MNWKIPLFILLFSTPVLAVEPVPVISGGVGAENMQAIKEARSRYNLELMLTGAGGIYLSDVVVNIRNKQGEQVASSVSEGPVMLVKLEPGRYTVEAVAEGYTQRITVAVGSTIKTYNIRFPIKDEDVMPSTVLPVQ